MTYVICKNFDIHIIARFYFAVFFFGGIVVEKVSNNVLQVFFSRCMHLFSPGAMTERASDDDDDDVCVSV